MMLPASPGRRAICEQLRNAVLEARLRPGELLPPSRDLAGRLGMSRATVVSVYEQLAGVRPPESVSVPWTAACAVWSCHSLAGA